MPIVPCTDDNFYIVVMKFIASLFVASMLLCACSDDAAMSEIKRLAQENAKLFNTVDSLKKNLDSLTAYGDSVNKSLEKLDMHP